MKAASPSHQPTQSVIQSPSDALAIERHLLSINFAAASSAVLDAALELNIVDQLSDEPRTAAEVADSAGWCLDGTRRLLRALSHLKVVHADHDRFYVTRPVAELLSQSSINSMTCHLQAVYANRDSWRDIAKAVRGGARTNRLGTLARRAENVEFLMRGGRQLLNEARYLASLTSRASGDAAVVLYSGGGEWALAQAEAGNARTIYAVDHPAFLNRARTLFDAYPTDTRIELVPCESEVQSHPAAASIVVLPPVLRFLDELSMSAVIAAAIANLGPDGELFVVDVLNQSADASSLHPMLDLSLLINTASGSIRDAQYYQQLIERGGGQLMKQHNAGMLTILRVQRRES